MRRHKSKIAVLATLLGSVGYYWHIGGLPQLAQLLHMLGSTGGQGMTAGYSAPVQPGFPTATQAQYSPYPPSTQNYNAGYNPKINAVRTDAFPNQYVAFDGVLGNILKHVDDNTYVFIVSDHGIKPLREFEQTDPHAHMDHEKTTPVIAKHDFADGDDVPGSFFAMGPGIKQDFRLMGFEVSVYDLAPTILHLYGIEPSKQMRGHVISEILEHPENGLAQK